MLEKRKVFMSINPDLSKYSIICHLKTRRTVGEHGECQLDRRRFVLEVGRRVSKRPRKNLWSNCASMMTMPGHGHRKVATPGSFGTDGYEAKELNSPSIAAYPRTSSHTSSGERCLLGRFWGLQILILRRCSPGCHTGYIKSHPQNTVDG